MKGIFFLVACVLLMTGYREGRSQEPAPVVWRFDAVAGEGIATLHMEAVLLPGWHLYSQFLKDGGPVPTRFYFEPDGRYALTGTTRERGDATSFFDDIYEMDVTWYSGTASFEQDILMGASSLVVRGHVDYMVCNQEICVPASREFTVEIGAGPE